MKPPRNFLRQPFASVAMAGLMALAWPAAAILADDFPNGCVSCHVVLPDGSDKRLGPVLADVGHVSIKGKVSRVPGDCIACHDKKSDAKFSVLVHQAHFAKTDTNVFIQHFSGDCRHCHVMNAATGVPNVKEGDANW